MKEYNDDNEPQDYNDMKWFPLLGCDHLDHDFRTLFCVFEKIIIGTDVLAFFLLSS